MKIRAASINTVARVLRVGLKDLLPSPKSATEKGWVAVVMKCVTLCLRSMADLCG